ncbi:MAG: hypothetical protein Q8878_05125, partial [Bacillota bacterium]|nr:hypothetical protein [Bacillota bacterium]
MKKLTAVFIVLIIAVSLSGCILKSGDDLLSLPKPPSDYLALQKNLDKIGQSGAGLTSPVSGKNQAPIQLVDLDGDGEAEAISLFRLSDSSGQFRVYVHKKEGGSYSEVGYIEGHGDSIESISYPRSDSSGGRSILVSWRLGASELGMTVYSYENGRLRAMLDSEYSNLLIDDIDQDGTDEIVTVVKEAKTNRFAAKLYLFQNDTLKMASET